MMAPCSVKASGKRFGPRYFLELVAICDQFARNSLNVRWNTKLPGKRLRFLRTGQVRVQQYLLAANHDDTLGDFAGA